MIEKNLKTRNKFINKLHIKIEDLNNNVILLSKVDKQIFKNIINQIGGTKIIQSINIRDMFINKLFIKIENLKNNFTLLSKVDKTIFKNIINQKGGTSIIDNINQAFLYVAKMKYDISTYNEDILKLTKIDNDLNKNTKNISTFLNILVNYFGNPYKKSNRYNEIDKDDLETLYQLMETGDVDKFLTNPKNEILINKIEPDLFNKFFGNSYQTTSRTTSRTTSPATSPTTSTATSRATSPATSPAISPTSTPRTIFDAPTGVKAIAGDTEATVNWTAPIYNGGSPITSYTVTSSPGGLTAKTPDGTTTNATVTGLTNDTPYTFTVVATNATRNLSPSIASIPITPKIKYPITIHNGTLITTNIIHFPQVKITHDIIERNYNFLHYIYKTNPNFYNELFYNVDTQNSRNIKNLQKLLLSINYKFYITYYYIKEPTFDPNNILEELKNDKLIKLLSDSFWSVFRNYTIKYQELKDEYANYINYKKSLTGKFVLTNIYKNYIKFKYNFLYIDDNNIREEIQKIANDMPPLTNSFNQEFFEIFKKEILNQMSYMRDLIIKEDKLDKIGHNSPFILQKYINTYTKDQIFLGKINESLMPSSHLSLTIDELDFYNNKIRYFI